MTKLFEQQEEEEDPAQEPPWGDPDVPEEGGLAQRGEEA